MKNFTLKKQRMFIILFFALIPMFILPFFFERLSLSTYISENKIFEDICVHYDAASQDIKLSFSETQNTWYAFLPSHISNQTIQFVHQNNKLIVTDDNNQINPTLVLSNIKNGDSFTLHVKLNNDTISSGNVVIFQATHLPTMYINTSSGSLEYIHTSKNNKEQANFTILKTDGTIDSSGECVFKGRGNSSWAGGMDGTGEKKPYNINLASETSLLEMGSQLKWTLLACYDDQAFIRNKIALELAQKLNCEYTPQAEFLNLYTNGEYKGLYLLTQRIAVDGGCVNIHDLSQENNALNTAREYETYNRINNSLEEHGIILNKNPENISGGYLLEFDVRVSDETGWFSTPKNKIAIKSPAPISVEQLNYIAEHMRNAEKSILDDVNIQTYLEYIDLESWAKMYVLQDFLLNFDVNYASFYVYKKANNNLIYAGPLWDFDLSMGNIHTGEYMEFTKQVQWIEGNSNRLWLNSLMKKTEFANLVTNIYHNDFWTLLSEITTIDIPLWIEQLETSATMDALLWKKENYSFTIKTDELLKWLIERKQFIIDYHANPERYEKEVQIIDTNRSFIHYNKIAKAD